MSDHSASSRAELACLIDHTLLKASATSSQIDALCEEAATHGFATVCVNPSYVPRAAARLGGSGVGVCTVVGFPLGATTAAAKAFEARTAVADGATEVDMVLAIGALKNRDYAAVSADIRGVVRASNPAPVKVILETALLERDEIIIACALSKEAGAAFVKTSTGFGGAGATVEHVALMREVVGPDIGVKASGGIRDEAAARAMVEAGANRLGCSAGVAIVTGGSATSGY